MFEPNTWVWIEDNEEIYLPAQVLKPFSRGSSTTVRTEDGEDVHLSTAKSAALLECNPEALDSSIQDLICINDLSEMAILHNLRIRYKEDKIYTNISSILISVNPFKLLPLYTPEILDKYRRGTGGDGPGLPPHVFSIAYNAYSSMLGSNSNQSVVISGESGAGKSEATKLILQFLTEVSSKSSAEETVAPTDSSSKPMTSSLLEQQILAANPILEAFGNAKTLRNNNSSRFGKLITVKFDASGGITGGTIINYLLEKSRVVQQTIGERNYHVFYQLLAAANKSRHPLTQGLNLQSPEMFQYTNQSGVIAIDGVSDEQEFEDVTNSLNLLQFSKPEQQQMFQLVAGVLHCGNIKFEATSVANADDVSNIVSPEALRLAGDMWGISPEVLGKVMLEKKIGARSEIVVPYNVVQSHDARDAMVKRVYSELFQFMVNKINLELSRGGKECKVFIGVLDIFGFESFEVNSFEQLCINYCNEKLQFHFNEHIFSMEQQLYVAEGISIDNFNFVDNQPTLDLLEAKSVGIFSMCDEEISVPRGSDEGFLQKLFSKHAKHPNLTKPKSEHQCKDCLKCFGVVHYAGTVYYNVHNFLDKNKDQLHGDIINVMKESTVPLLKELFTFPEPVTPVVTPLRAAPAVPGSAARTPLKSTLPPRTPLGAGSTANSPMVTPSRGGAAKAKTLGGQFKAQLKDLLDTLNSTHPHFIRCMKSNDLKIGNVFNGHRMQDQLRYSGLVEVCRIRKLGYPDRKNTTDFFKRYQCLYSAGSGSCASVEELLIYLESQKVLRKGEWARGSSRIFMKTTQTVTLEQHRDVKVTHYAIKAQAGGRMYNSKKKFKYYKKLMSATQAAMDIREEKGIANAIDMLVELPWNGAHVPITISAKLLLRRIREEHKLVALLEEAITLNDLIALENAVSETNKLVPLFYPAPEMDKATNMIVRLKEELKVKRLLGDVMKSRNFKELCALLDQAVEMRMAACVEVTQGEALKARLIEEERSRVKLQQSIDARDEEVIVADMAVCAELGLGESAVMKAAQQVVLDIQEEKATNERLRLEKEAKQREEEKQRQIALEKRLALMDKMKTTLLHVCTLDDIAVINEALQVSIQLGYEGPEIAQAHKAIADLQAVDEAMSKLTAEVKILKDKAPQGLSEDDLVALTAAITSADGLTLPHKKKAVLKETKIAFLLYKKQLDASIALKAALKTPGNLGELEAALHECKDMVDMKTEDMSIAMEILRVAAAEAAEAKAKAAEAAEAKAKAAEAAKPKPVPQSPVVVAENAAVVTATTSARRSSTKDVSEPRRASVSSAANAVGTGTPDIKYNASPMMRRQSVEPSRITEKDELDGDSDDDVDEDALRRQNRLEMAGQPRFELSHFTGMRSPDDYAKGFLLNKGKIKEQFFVFQSEKIPKSLTFTKYPLKSCQQIFKGIMGYMGDRVMPYPAMLAQDMLKKGSENLDLRDEIYLQIIKQMKENPRPASVAKGWQLLCMCVTTFQPSAEFQLYLFHYLLERRTNARGAFADYAKYCLRSLESICDQADSTSFVPCVEEIEAYRERPPILVTVESLDGQIIAEDVPITPDVNVEKVVMMCFNWMHLTDPRAKSLGLFVHDLGELDNGRTAPKDITSSLILSPRPLGGAEFLGDIVVQKARQNREYKFVFKKKIFLEDENPHQGTDRSYMQLVYTQVEDEVLNQGNMIISEEDVVCYLGALSLSVAFRDCPPTTAQELIDYNVIDFVAPSWREKYSVEQWADKLLKSTEECLAHSMTAEEYQDEFIAQVCEHPMFGTHWFYVHSKKLTGDEINPKQSAKFMRQLPHDLCLGFNSNGFSIYDEELALYVCFGFEDICRWGGSPTQFSIIVTDVNSNRSTSKYGEDANSLELNFVTAQSTDMAALIVDYIAAVMAAQGTEA